ncbi:MAG: ankyrin repeat domain-containing protein, partial [Gammaproteobacteria bacterium]
AENHPLSKLLEQFITSWNQLGNLRAQYNSSESRNSFLTAFAVGASLLLMKGHTNLLEPGAYSTLNRMNEMNEEIIEHLKKFSYESSHAMLKLVDEFQEIAEQYLEELAYIPLLKSILNQRLSIFQRLPIITQQLVKYIKDESKKEESKLLMVCRKHQRFQRLLETDGLITLATTLDFDAFYTDFSGALTTIASTEQQQSSNGNDHPSSYNNFNQYLLQKLQQATVFRRVSQETSAAFLLNEQNSSLEIYSIDSQKKLKMQETQDQDQTLSELIRAVLDNDSDYIDTHHHEIKALSPHTLEIVFKEMITRGRYRLFIHMFEAGVNFNHINADGSNLLDDVAAKVTNWNNASQTAQSAIALRCLGVAWSPLNNTERRFARNRSKVEDNFMMKQEDIQNQHYEGASEATLTRTREFVIDLLFYACEKNLVKSVNQLLTARWPKSLVILPQEVVALPPRVETLGVVPQVRITPADAVRIEVKQTEDALAGLARSMHPVADIKESEQPQRRFLLPAEREAEITRTQEEASVQQIIQLCFSAAKNPKLNYHAEFINLTAGLMGSHQFLENLLHKISFNDPRVVDCYANFCAAYSKERPDYVFPQSYGALIEKSTKDLTLIMSERPKISEAGESWLPNGRIIHINYRNKQGLTFLHKAAGYGHESIVRNLISLGADPTLKTESQEDEMFSSTMNGETAAQYASHSVGNKRHLNTMFSFLRVKEEETLENQFVRPAEVRMPVEEAKQGMSPQEAERAILQKRNQLIEARRISYVYSLMVSAAGVRSSNSPAVKTIDEKAVDQVSAKVVALLVLNSDANKCMAAFKKLQPEKMHQKVFEKVLAEALDKKGKGRATVYERYQVLCQQFKKQNPAFVFPENHGELFMENEQSSKIVMRK